MTFVAAESMASCVAEPTTIAAIEASRRAHDRQRAIRMVRVALQRQDDLVLSLTYGDRHGEQTQRIVSPIRFLDSDRFLALCLCRCEPRQFHLSRCSQIELKWAADYVMPVQMTTVQPVGGVSTTS